MEGMMPKRKTVKKVQPAIEIVDAPAPASKIAKYALESRQFHAEAEQSDLSRIQNYHQELQPDRKRLETALAQFNAIAPEAKKQLREIESHRWAGGSIPTGNLAEEVAKLRGYLFGGIGFTKAVDIQIKELLAGLDNFVGQVQLWQKSTRRPLEDLCDETSRDIRTRVAGIIPICGRDIPRTMASIEEKYPPAAEADKERWRLKLGGAALVIADLPPAANDNITIETNLNHG
jgi:hypothetical protein